jgi:hypothetical protein
MSSWTSSSTLLSAVELASDRSIRWLWLLPQCFLAASWLRLKMPNEGLAVAEIVVAAQLRNRSAAGILLLKMTKAGEIERVKRGVYAIPGTVAKFAARCVHPFKRRDAAPRVVRGYGAFTPCMVEGGLQDSQFLILSGILFQIRKPSSRNRLGFSERPTMTDPPMPSCNICARRRISARISRSAEAEVGVSAKPACDRARRSAP